MGHGDALALIGRADVGPPGDDAMSGLLAGLSGHQALHLVLAVTSKSEDGFDLTQWREREREM